MAARFALLAYEGIEPIDIGATFGVLSMARRVEPAVEAFVVAPRPGRLMMANNLTIEAHHGIASCPDFDVLIVLGGPGWQVAATDEAILGFVRAAHRPDVILASVCTGAMILAAAGVLAGHTATTKAEVVDGEPRPLDLLGAAGPGIAAEHARIVDAGSIVTGGGVSLGHDLTLFLLSRTVGARVARETARIIEYGAAYRANAERLPDIGIARPLYD